MSYELESSVVIDPPSRAHRGAAALRSTDVSLADDCPLAPMTAASVAAPANDAVARLSAALDQAFRVTADADEPSLRAEFARRVRAALAEAAADDTLLTPAQREGSTECYRRHLLAADPLGRYAVVALVWQPGQASPVHGHQTWCGYTVLEGTLTETVYDWNEAAGCATEARTHARDAGAVSYTRAGLTGIHRLGNASTAPAISLHLYGVPGTQIATHVNDLVRVGTATVHSN